MNEVLTFYIFGAHSRGQTLSEYLEYLFPDFRLIAFLYNNEEDNPKFINGIPVIDIGEKDLCLNTAATVFLGMRGVYHDLVIQHLLKLGFEAENIIPVTPQLDMQLRNEYLRKYYAEKKEYFGKIEDLSRDDTNPKNTTNVNKDTQRREILALDAQTCLYVTKSINDAILSSTYIEKMYERPMEVGASLNTSHIENITIRDNQGDNISDRNRQFCELTAIYWIWKNAKEDIVGLEHYRRHFILPNDWLERMIDNDIDVILPTPLCVVPSLAQNYRDRHVEEDWVCLSEYIKQNLPKEYDSFTDFFENTGIYSPCNMFIMKREVLDELCTWMFPILFACVETIGEHEDTYQNRYPGFMSERLITYFFEHNRDKYRVVYADKNFLT